MYSIAGRKIYIKKETAVMVSSILNMRPPESGGTQELAKQNEPSKRNDKEVKAKQARKIRELGDALVLQGFRTLDQQAQALGLGRSTAWIILKANHKASGLSAAVINRMLAAPWLPPLVRAKMLEYIDEKIAGSYGHSKTQIRRFTARLSGKGFNQARTNEDTDIGLQRRKSNLRVVELRGTT
jgi:hypothetical protein